jgi:oxygen-dependent protoporphyrinogen oxidase
VLIVGGSFNAMLLALKLAKLDPKQKIILIEKEKDLGGLYKSFHYQDGIVFDIDVHIYTETCDPEIDRLVFDLLPEHEWEIMEGQRRDISGLYFNGKLQTNTPYPDLRSYKEETKSKFLGDLFINLEKDINSHHYGNASDFLEAKFGKALNEAVFSKILEKHYHTAPRELDPMATYAIPVTRIVIYDNEIMADLMPSNQIRSRLAFPDQCALPPCYLRAGRLIYPKRYGIQNLVKVLEQRLLEHKVEIYTNANVKSLESQNGEISSVNIENGKQSWQEAVGHLYWAAGLPSLGAQLNIPLDNLPKQYIKSVFVNLIFDKQPLCDGMYYHYCFDPGFYTFRIVNYTSYCPGARNHLGYPLCVTLWPKEGEDMSYEELAVSELRRMGVITDHKVTFAKAETIGRGFPLPTVKNIQAVDALREAINARQFKNLTLTGILAKKGLFYLNDVLVDVFKSIKTGSLL